jgi:colicin import membrane protein
MNVMKKILLAVMAVAAIGFTSCGNKTQQAEATDSTEVAINAEEEANAVIDNLKAFVAAGDAEKVAAALDQVKEMVGEFVLNDPDAAMTYVTTVQNYLKENAEQIKAVVDKNADAASAVAVFMETEPEVMVSAIVETVSNKAEATKDAAEETAVNAKDAAVDAAVAAKDAAVDAAKQKVDEANAAAKQKAEETKAAAKKQANDAIDDAAKNVKKGLGI